MSDGNAAIEIVGDRRALRLQGTVSLERNGGFLQMARPFGLEDLAYLHAHPTDGLAIDVCGVPGTYFVHLRTGDTRAPWQYYAADLPVTPHWQRVHVRWSTLVPVSLQTPFALSRLQRIGIVAAQSAFHADIAVARIVLTP
jgi:hypothetical protein